MRALHPVLFGLLLGVLLATAPALAATGAVVLDITTCGATADDRSDCTPAVQVALARCRSEGLHTLVFPKGRYDFFPARAPERYLAVSNNDPGLKRIAFPLVGFSDLTIDGQGADLVFHGFIVPFALDGAHAIVLKSLSIDWQRPFHSEGVVVAADAGGVELTFSDEFPYKVVNGRFVPQGDNQQGAVIDNALEFDTALRETAFQVSDNYGFCDKVTASAVSPGRVRFAGTFTAPRPKPGNLMALMPSHRLCPAIAIQESRDVRLQDVAIFHAGAMGVIAQRSSGLVLERVVVAPRPGGRRLISATADATHFSGCGGAITMTGCRFENQVDDATNVHGIYTRVTGHPDERSVEVALMHPQQFGLRVADVGDTMQFIHADTLAGYHRAAVTAVRVINQQYTVLTFAAALPAEVRLTDAVLDLRWSADFTARGNRARGNRARGFLISTPGKVLVEDNDFHVPGSAIIIAGDANYWFESGPVTDVTIRGNRFTACGYGVWGRATIAIEPEIRAEHRGSPRYHHGIRITGNAFEVVDNRVLFAHSVAGLEFTGNTFVASGAYPPVHADAQRFAVSDCDDVLLQDAP